MNKEEQLFYKTGESIEGSEKSQMFGKPCFKINGKAFVCFFQNCMVFKLGGIEHKDALDLKGAVLFDPSGKGRPMKEWVQLSYEYKSKWNYFAGAAFKYVKG